MYIKKKFRGMGQHRFSREPLEKRFAEAWQRLNDTDTPGRARSTLDYLMDESGRGEPNPPLTDRDWLVASTVIQWLGSPVGQCFVAEVMSLDDGHGFREYLDQLVMQQAEDRHQEHKK